MTTWSPWSPWCHCFVCFVQAWRAVSVHFLRFNWAGDLINWALGNVDNGRNITKTTRKVDGLAFTVHGYDGPKR